MCWTAHITIALPNHTVFIGLDGLCCGRCNPLFYKSVSVYHRILLDKSSRISSLRFLLTQLVTATCKLVVREEQAFTLLGPHSAGHILWKPIFSLEKQKYRWELIFGVIPKRLLLLEFRFVLNNKYHSKPDSNN